MGALETYGIGVLAIVGFVAYVWAFKVSWFKLTGESLNDGEYGILGGIVMSLVIPLAVGLILFVPYLVGREILG